ncbi:MAG: tRNA (N(6)-L-threonylcarbamoyladenosine(37)-C(2))-methylthiotransferase MtaB [Oscillospiraceae bacterium]|nr:tRNA (N(6)-L-threonylcarbamoyladenosine(37)-C(2))-methylthiotransferase MtaB [Oscillospiraceae bacterium]
MKFYITTLGCKVNQFESQAICQLLSDRGHTLVSEGEHTDVIIINTCAVTAESGRKSRQAIRHLQKANPDAISAVCGCYSQTCGTEIDELGIDLISGSGDRIGFVSELEKIFEQREKKKLLDNPRSRRIFEVLPSGSTEGRTRAMMKIQDGCQNFCTYCIIPYARGPVRSMPIDDIKREAADLYAQGFAEIVVTGIEISSYGMDFKDGTSLIDAIYAISEAAPGVRIHLGSLEPRTANEEFCRMLSEVPNICPHFHLSLQSGCDTVLKRMKRKYDTELFYSSCVNLRKYFPNCGITTDLLTGFPGETEEEFSQTLEFIKKCDFSAMHVFPYSIRPGTPAAKMENQIDKKVKKERAAKASAIANEMSESFANAQIGMALRVLFETETDGVSRGHSENYLEVEVLETGLHGKVLNVQVTDTKNCILRGQLIK